METKSGIKTFYASSRQEWRKWLKKNYQSEKPVFLILYNKKSKTPGISYGEAIEEALCFGWIDSTAYKRDEDSFYLYFTRRKPKSQWSKINRERALKMIKKGLMTEYGQAFIDLAKEKGTWISSEEINSEVIPEDLQKLFNKNKTAFNNFKAFPPSSKKIILGWIFKAKRPETRQKRILKTVELAAENIRANHPAKK
ncbi:MAG: YdeI/OmpD-associated family protein [Ignavibacteriaceae bacterium]